MMVTNSTDQTQALQLLFRYRNSLSKNNTQIMLKEVDIKLWNLLWVLLRLHQKSLGNVAQIYVRIFVFRCHPMLGFVFHGYFCVKHLWVNGAQTTMFSCVRQPTLVGVRKAIKGRIVRQHQQWAYWHNTADQAGIRFFKSWQDFFTPDIAWFSKTFYMARYAWFFTSLTSEEVLDVGHKI